jgi:hypothetical protein
MYGCPNFFMDKLFVEARARDSSGKPPSAALGMNSARWQAEGAWNG